MAVLDLIGVGREDILINNNKHIIARYLQVCPTLDSKMSNTVLFATALILSAVSATDDVSHAVNQLYRTTHDHHTISPRRRFNLEAILPPLEEEDENEAPIQEEANAAPAQQEGNELFWREADHEYEPPVHNPKYHEEMPTGPVRTVHDLPISTRDHPSEQEHPTSILSLEEVDYPERIERGEGEHWEEPRNFFFEHPNSPEIHEADKERLMSAELSAELARRHLGRTQVKRPIWTKQSLSDIVDTQNHTQTVSQLVETVYDDLSVDNTLYSQTTDKNVETNIGFMPDEDGILKTFIDRYTTMLIHDSIYMEQMPAPHFMHQSLSLLNPGVAGSLKHDPRHLDEPIHEAFVYEADEQPSLHRILRTTEQAEIRHPAESHHLVRPSPAQIVNQPHDTESYYGDSEFETRHYDHSNDLRGAVAREGASHLADTLGMHFKEPEEVQVIARESESAHRYQHHPVTRYDPDDFRPHHPYGHVEDESHESLQRRAHEPHGLPVHDVYGERAIEHDPYHHEFVHGTNYELGMHRDAPVIEHNSHAFTARGELGHDLDAAKHATHAKDSKETPSPVIKLPAPKATQPKKEQHKSETPASDKKPTQKQLPQLILDSSLALY